MANADSLRQKLIQQAEDAISAATDDMVADLKDGAPYLTGETKAEIYADPISSRSPQFSSKITSPTPQGEWVEDGTSPHLIVPVNAQALHFFIGSKEIFTKSVNHPGTPPRPWFHPITDRWSEYLSRQFN